MKKTLKKLSICIIAMCMLFAAAPIAALAVDNSTDTQVVVVNTAQELVDVLNDTTALPVQYKNLTVKIESDIDFTDVEWVSGFVNGYCGAETYTVEGNGHNLTGLTSSLFRGTWAGNGNLIIKDLTIADSVMSGGADSQGFGAFVGHTEATSQVTLENCHLVNSKVTGVDWTGGFVGYAAGYDVQNNGPVFENIDIVNCSVKNSEITGGGSTGGIIGHATGNNWTSVNIDNCVVENNKVVCTDDSNKKAGSVIGTVGVAGKNTVAGKTGAVSVNAIVKGNTVTSNDVVIKRIFGRFGSGGTLNITGGTYLDCFKTECVAPDNGVLNISDDVKFKLADVSEGNAIVGDGVIENAIEKSEENSTVVLPLEDAADTVVSVELSVESLNAVVDAEKTLTISTTEVTVVLDSKTLESISAQAEESESVVISVKEIKEDDLSEEQNDALKDKKVAAIISAEILCNDENIRDFDGGFVTIKIPFTLAENAKVEDYKVIYVADDGKIEEINTEYVDSCIVVKLEHFSEYVIVDNSTSVDSDEVDSEVVPDTGDDTDLVILFIVMTLSIIALLISLFLLIGFRTSFFKIKR